MSGHRVSVDVHHTPGEPREVMLVFNGWSVWKLTADEARELYAQLGLRLAHARAMEMADATRRSMPFADWAAEQDERRLDLMGEPF